jgi:hypothetical protein
MVHSIYGQAAKTRNPAVLRRRQSSDFADAPPAVGRSTGRHTFRRQKQTLTDVRQIPHPGGRSYLGYRSFRYRAKDGSMTQNRRRVDGFKGGGHFSGCPRSPHPSRRSVHGPYDILFEPILQLAAMAPLILYASEPLATRVSHGSHLLLLANLWGQPYPKLHVFGRLDRPTVHLHQHQDR